MSLRSLPWIWNIYCLNSVPTPLGPCLEGALHRRHGVLEEPVAQLRLIERVGGLDRGTQRFDGGIGRRGMIIRVLVVFRLVGGDELGIARRLERAPPCRVGDDPVGKRPKRAGEL